jgi:hypothetical protein
MVVGASTSMVITSIGVGRRCHQEIETDYRGFRRFERKEFRRDDEYQPGRIYVEKVGAPSREQKLDPTVL